VVIVEVFPVMKIPHLTILAALAFTAAGAFMAGRVSSQGPETDAGKDAGTARTARASGMPMASESAAGHMRRTKESERRSASGAERLSRLESIIRGENPLDRSRSLLAFIDQLGPEDFEEAVAHFRSLGLTEERMGEYAMLLSAWAKADPLSALAFAKENTRSRFATDTILTTWASVDPEAAIRWAEANHTGDGANPNLAGIIRGLASTDPQRATQLLTGMPKSIERGQALDAMMPWLLSQGNGATRAWIEGITDDSLRNGAMLRAAERMAATDPAGTVAWLLENPGEASQRRMDDVYSAWARKDEQAAMSSLATLPAGEIRSDALRGLVSSAALRDPAHAVSIMDRYAGDVDYGVVRNFIWHSFGRDPALAMDQIPRIADAGERDQMYLRVVSRWIDRDPAAANAWMQGADLPPSVHTALQRRFSSGGQ
jgi:hypothetical protein